MKVAVIWALLTTETFETVTPAPLTFTDAPGIKFEPVSVTLTEVPCTPDEGVRDESTGAAAVTLKVAGLLVPAEVVTDTLYGPVTVPAAIVRVAVIWELFTTETL